jgi:hypothetical protein
VEEVEVEEVEETEDEEVNVFEYTVSKESG